MVMIIGAVALGFSVVDEHWKFRLLIGAFGFMLLLGSLIMAGTPTINTPEIP